MTSEATPQGTVAVAFDAAGRRQTMSATGQPTVTYTFDNANRLTQLQAGTATIGFGYDDADRRTSVTYPNGIVGTFAFSNVNQVLSISYDKGATHVGDLSYTYDAAQRRVSQGGSLSTLGMPTAVSMTYDAANRLTAFGSTALTYDNNGNLVSFTPGTYTWNARNLLTAASDGTSSFSYDAIGRQVSRKVQSVTTTDLYDGADPVVINGSLMLNGVGLDDNFARLTGSVATSFLTDALGSTKALTDATGAVSASYTYQPYGGASKTGTDDTPLQFTGRENDGAPGLYYYRARYYGAKIGRFISEDPIQFAGGLNFYAYANGNPISNRDPTGEFVPLIVILPVVGGIAGGISDVISAGPCTPWYKAFGRGFVSAEHVNDFETQGVKSLASKG